VGLNIYFIMVKYLFVNQMVRIHFIVDLLNDDTDLVGSVNINSYNYSMTVMHVVYFGPIYIIV
jgi:hypothetical protein